MKIGLLGATGAVGHAVAAEAAAGHHDVTALVRNPSRMSTALAATLTMRTVDATDSETLRAALTGLDVVISTLGLRTGDSPATFTAAAQVLAVGDAPRAVWLGSLGTGTTRKAAGPLFGPVFAWVLRREAAAKTAADELITGSGSTVVHSPPFTSKPATGQFALCPADQVRRQVIITPIPKADLARLLLQEAINPQHRGGVAVTCRPKTARLSRQRQGGEA